MYIYYILQVSLPFWIQSSLDQYRSPCLCRPHGSKIGSGKTRTLASMVTQLNHFGWKFVENHIEAYYHSKSLRVYIFWYELPKRKLFYKHLNNWNCRIFPPINPPGWLDFVTKARSNTAREYATRSSTNSHGSGVSGHQDAVGLTPSPGLDDGQLWGHQDGVWSADGSHGPSEKNHVPRHFLGMSIGSKVVEMMIQNCGFLVGQLLHSSLFTFFFPAIKLHILIEMPEVCTSLLSHLCASGDWRSDCASVHAGQIGNKGPTFTIWQDLEMFYMFFHSQ